MFHQSYRLQRGLSRFLSVLIGGGNVTERYPADFSLFIQNKEETMILEYIKPNAELLGEFEAALNIMGKNVKEGLNLRAKALRDILNKWEGTVTGKLVENQQSVDSTP